MYGYPNNSYMYQQYPNFAESMNMVRQQQQMQQPIQQMQNAANQINSNPAVIWVQGENSAKSYLVARGETVVLRDSENPSRIYVKSADMNGVPSMETFNLMSNMASNANSNVSNTQSANIDYVTREEFETLKKRLNSFISDVAKEDKKDE